MKGISSTRFVLLAAMGLAAAAGYWFGTNPSNDPADENERAISVRARREGIAKESRRPAAEVVREAIKGGLDAREQWRQIRGFSEQEVKAAIGELGGPPRIKKLPWELPAMLFYRWAEMDPVAANKAAEELFPRGFPYPRQAVFAAWIKQGGGFAAWNAAHQGESGNVWDCTRSVPGEVADMLVASFSDLDDAAAFKEASRFDDAESSLVSSVLCEARATKSASTPESRAAFLAAASTRTNEFVVKRARESLFRAWAKRDREAALAGVNDLPISEEERESIRVYIR